MKGQIKNEILKFSATELKIQYIEELPVKLNPCIISDRRDSMAIFPALLRCMVALKNYGPKEINQL